MSGVRKTDVIDDKLTPEEEFQWSLFIACCLIGGMLMFVIAAIEMTI